MAEYAIYKGDEFLFVGTSSECCEFMGWKCPKTVAWYSTPTRFKRREKSKKPFVYTVRLE